jgi:hypothetical protein
MDSNFLKLVGYISSFIGIIGATFSVMIWFKIRLQNKKILELASQRPGKDEFKEMVKIHEGIDTTSPFALCISLTDRSVSIKGDVEYFFKTKKWKMPFEEINFSGLTHKNLDDFVSELKKKRRELNAKKATEIHLFISGPMQAAAIAGSIFSNWIPVKLYNLHPESRKYEYWCHLSK